MKITDFNPYVRYAAKILGPRPYPELICAYDHRMFYVVNGSFSIEFSKQTIPGLYQSSRIRNRSRVRLPGCFLLQ